ncbi:uncharacterized [Tachysurus ichikawai]
MEASSVRSILIRFEFRNPIAIKRERRNGATKEEGRHKPTPLLLTLTPRAQQPAPARCSTGRESGDRGVTVPSYFSFNGVCKETTQNAPQGD